MSRGFTERRELSFSSDADTLAKISIYACADASVLHSASRIAGSSDGKVRIDRIHYNNSGDVVTSVNDWLNRQSFNKEATTVTQTQGYERTEWSVTRKLQTPEAVVVVRSTGNSKKEARRRADFAFCHLYSIRETTAIRNLHPQRSNRTHGGRWGKPKVQMESIKESEQGLATQESEKAQNTIITRDEGRTDSGTLEVVTLSQHISSEPYVEVPALTDRWVPLSEIEVRTSMKADTMVKAYNLPVDLYSEIRDTTNLLLFETYIYSEFACEMKFVTNANRFQCGKVLITLKHDAFKCIGDYESTNANLCRTHVILDLASNNEGNIKVPFRFRRAAIRNVTHSMSNKAVRHAEAVRVIITILSPLRTGTGQVNSMYIRPYIKLHGTKFMGMSFRAKVQMPGPITGLLQSETMKGLVKDVENLLLTPNIPNTDGPSEIRTITVIPQPYGNFSCGKGPVSTKIARVNPLAMTSYSIVSGFPEDPQDLLQVARIWGLRSSFEWSASQKPGDTVGVMFVDPSYRNSPTYTNLTPTPLEYVCGMYAFWSGTIEVRLDFVSNAFHTGAVMVSIEFGRNPDDDDDLMQSSSTYTQTFHLGEQKSLHIQVPYIYDTVWRRSSTEVYTKLRGQTGGETKYKNTSYSTRPVTYTRVAVKVVNKLVPPDTVTQSIDVLWFVRAGPDFRVHGLKQSTWFPAREFINAGPHLDDFPDGDYRPETLAKAPQVSKPKRAARESDVHIFTEEEVTTTYPRVQMDSGEDRDPTANFNVGRPNLQLQTTDSQTNIKDILRRRTMIVENFFVPANIDFALPIMVPSRNMYTIPTPATDVYCPMLLQHPTTMVVNMFRFWRGSTRLTFFVRPLEPEALVYFVHLPHTGARRIGLQPMAGLSMRHSAQSSGLSTEIMLPQLNPLITIEFPYDTENVWTLTHEDDSRENYLWRDKGDTNCGHVVITCIGGIYLTAWWSAGDDFMLSNFYGIPKCLSNGVENIYPDEADAPKAKVQIGDFHSTDVSNLRSYVNHVLSSVDLASIATGCVSALPIVGQLASSIATHATIRGVANTASNTMLDVKDEMRAIANTVSKADPILDSVAAILEGIRARCGDGIVNFPVISKLVTDAATAISMSLCLKSWIPLSTTIVTSVKDMLLSCVSISELGGYVADLTQHFEYIMPQRGPRVQAPSKEATITGILAGLVGLLFRVQLDHNKYGSHLMALTKMLTETQGLSYLNQTLMYVQKIFETVTDMAKDALGLADPELQALKIIGDNSELLNQFILDAQMVTSEENKANRGCPKFREKYFMVVIQALQIQRAIVLAKGNVAHGPLARFVEGVLKKAEEHHMDLRSCPVRIVPFVVTIEGPSAVGKSFLALDLTRRLHEAVDVKPSPAGFAYTRQSGTPYWTNYSDQKFIIMDDYGQRTDSASVIAETDDLFNLTTDQNFTPPMAHLEDKKMYANPLGVLLLTNDAYAAHLTQQNHDKEAYMRRRNVVFRVEKKPEYRKIPTEDIDPEILQKYEHLQVMMYKDACSASKGFYDGILSYEEFCSYLQTMFKVHYEKKVRIQKDRIKKIYECIRGMEVGDMHFGDPHRLFSEMQIRATLSTEQGKLVFMEQLQTAAKHMVRMAEEAFSPELGTHVPTKTTNPFIRTQAMGEDIQGLLPFKPSQLLNPIELINTVRETIDKGRTGNAMFNNVFLGLGHNCDVCRKQMECIYTCSNTNKKCCTNCTRRKEYVMHPVCPLCSDERQHLEAGRGWVIWYAVAQMIAEVGIAVIAHAFGYFWTGVAARLALNIACMYHDIEDTFRMYHMRRQRYADATAPPAPPPPMAPETQMAWPSLEQPKTQIDYDPADPMFTPVVFEDKVNELCKWFTRSGVPCRHEEMVKSPRSCIYTGGPEQQWKVPGPSTSATEACFLLMDARPCDENCPLADFETHLQFMREYLDNHLVDLRRLYVDYYNYPKNRELTMSKIPTIIRPNWMEPTINAPPADWWNTLQDQWKKYRHIFWALTASGVVLATVVKVVQWFTHSAHTQYDSPTMGRPETINRPRTTRPVYTVKKNQPIVQVSTSLAAETSEKLFHNQVFIRAWLGGEEKRVLVGFGIRAHYALIPRHYVPAMEKMYKEGYTYTIEPVWSFTQGQNHLRKPYNYCSIDFTLCEQTDIAIFSLPPSFPMFKDVVRFFLKDCDTTRDLPSKGIIIQPDTGKNATKILWQVEVEPPQEFVESYDDYGNTYTTRFVLPYNFSAQGACGSLLILPNAERPIAAMHVCGFDNGVGFGVIITQEILAELVVNRVPETQMEDVRMLPVEEVPGSMIFPMDTYVDYLGAVPPEDRPHISCKTKIVPSRLNNNDPFVAKTEPAILSSQDPRWAYDASPLYHGSKKHGMVPRDFKTDEVCEVENVLYDKIFRGMRPLVVDPHKLTWKEAVVGKPGRSYYDGLKLSTSSGYPWTNINKVDKTKFAWIEPILDEQRQMVDCKIHPDLLAEIERKDELRKQGIQPVTIFVDTLKDERLKHEKALRCGGTRVFCASPIDYTITMRSYLLHFNAAFMSNRLSIQSAVGINPMGPEWTQLAQHLNSVSMEYIVGLDYSNFGPRFHAQLARAAAGIMHRWTMENVKGVDSTSLWMVLMECINSVHIAGSTVYQQFCGSPSGAPITVIINSIVNMLYILLSWKALCRERVLSKGYGPWNEFFSYTRLVVYGDDLVMSVHRDYKDIFNGRTICEYLAQYDITATDTEKGSSITPYQPLFKASFLKRGFRMHDQIAGMWLGPLNLDVINEIPQWRHKGLDEKNALYDTCHTALLEMHAYGIEEFQKFKELINIKFRKLRVKLSLVDSWYDVDDLWFKGELGLQATIELLPDQEFDLGL